MTALLTRDPFTRSAPWLVLFALYFLIQALIRVIFGDRMNIDEAEAFLWAQHWAWGYGPQPPAYIWLQGLVFSLTGPSATGLALLKACTLWTIFALSFALVRRWCPPGRTWLAGLSVLMLFWLPELVWESQRIRTHNVTVTLCTLALIWQALRLQARPTVAQFAGFGLVVGAGLLSKWTFAPVPLAIVLLWALRPATRGLVTRPASALMLIVPLALCLPTLGWMLGHPQIAFASAAKLGFDPGLSRLDGAVAFLRSAVTSVLVFSILPLLVLGGVALTLIRARTPEALPAPLPRPEERRFVLRVIALTLGLIVLGGAVSGATELRLRWLMPVLTPALPLIALCVLARLGPGIRRGLVTATLMMPVLLCIASAWMLRNAPPLKAIDLEALAVALVAPLQAADTPEVIIAREIMAANLSTSPALTSETGAAPGEPRRIWRDPSWQMDSPCPASALVLEPDPAHPLAAYLAACGLIPGKTTEVHFGADQPVLLLQELGPADGPARTPEAAN